MFTLTYEGDSGEDVLAAALDQLITNGVGPLPWVVDLTFLDDAGNETTATVGVVTVVQDSAPSLIVIDYDTATHTFGDMHKSRNIELAAVTKVVVV